MLLRTYRDTSKSKRGFEVAVLQCDNSRCNVHFERHYKDVKSQKTHFCSYTCINVGRTHTPEWKTHMSIKNSGTANPFYGKKHTVELIERLSQERSGISYVEKYGTERALEIQNKISESITGENNPFYGRTHTSQSKELISKNHRDCSGVLNPMYQQGHKIAGEKNGSWIDGRTNDADPYQGFFTDQLKQEIRKRDKFKCNVCNRTGVDVHHVDYDKLNNQHDNLITLCRSCHMKTNFNREYWVQYFQDIMNK